MQKIFLSNIQSLEINDFSLYSEKSIKINLSKSVSCLLGANGIGKSTLLNCINYAITGHINNTNNKIKSINDFVESNNYHLKYFEGRISESDKDFASVTVEYILNREKIRVKRNFFPNNNVIECTIKNEACNNYEDCIVAFSKVKSFNQFVFMQLKVLTFDESRDCLFWNQSVLTPTLFLCMGGDIENAEMADELSLNIQRHMSRIRNIQWEITKQSKRLEMLIEEKKNIFSGENEKAEKNKKESLKNEYEKVLNSITEKSTEYDNLFEEKKRLITYSTELFLKKQELENDYDNIYKILTKDIIRLEKNPMICNITSEPCSICGSVHSSMPKSITDSIGREECPLCGVKLKKEVKNDDEVLDKLNIIDKELHKIVDILKETNMRLKLVNTKMEQLNSELVESISNKNEIENSSFFSMLQDNPETAYNDRVNSLKSAIVETENSKRVETKRKDELKTEYDKLCVSFQKIYQETQNDFLPIFRRLAYAFTGLNLDMSLNSSPSDGRMMFRFILQIGNSNRNSEYELSESQRFFIDIALRMAIITYICSDEKQCSMLIDTPEGSLDIAYETNAGNMFSEYVAENHKLIITANLNSSGLIQTLAEKTGIEKFELISMLNWVNLSSVQSNYIELFSSAISDIEKRLEK